MNIHAIEEMKDLAGKYILVRDDFNVQIVDGVITDAFRIEQSLPTIRRLAAAGARVVIMSHLGRPNGTANPEFSLAPVAAALEQLLGRPVLFINDAIKKDFLPSMKNGDVALLENLRFHAGEEENDSAFAQRLADGFDYYVNDAFAVSHRAHASVDAVTNCLPSFAGELLASEIAAGRHNQRQQGQIQGRRNQGAGKNMRPRYMRGRHRHQFQNRNRHAEQQRIALRRISRGNDSGNHE